MTQIFLVSEDIQFCLQDSKTGEILCRQILLIFLLCYWNRMQQSNWMNMYWRPNTVKHNAEGDTKIRMWQLYSVQEVYKLTGEAKHVENNSVLFFKKKKDYINIILTSQTMILRGKKTFLLMTLRSLVIWKTQYLWRRSRNIFTHAFSFSFWLCMQKSDIS